jgi:hypothetical protein
MSKWSYGVLMNICVTASCYDTLGTIDIKGHLKQIGKLLVCIVPKAAMEKGERRVLMLKSCLVESKMNIKLKDKTNKYFFTLSRHFHIWLFTI